MTVHGRADHRDPAGAGGRCEDGGCLPSSRHLGCHLLQVEGQVWRAGRVGGATAEGVGGRERQAEEAAGGSDAGQRHAEGCRCKKMVTRSEEHTSELQSLMRISYAVFCLKKKKRE